ncbi:FliH/SctL family protein [uncultured Cohaesibacter sp.]|uniref:FliH/SctL family protein n=1 Tax=uncultured Cohaesibacter sp. TaxID=1002546 RepID=UPI0029C784B1|nr:FliH/SctL family protein [uncultured Cohaesibacter sp.]
MANAARYLFDLDFSARPEPEIVEEIEETPPEPTITVAEHERLMAEAIERARLAGEQAAREDREQLASEESLAVQKTILEDVGMIYTEVGTLLQRLERDASNLAFAFASRFAERLVAQEPKAEVLGLLHQILAPLRKTPHITIRLNDEIAEEIRVAVDQQMAVLGFEGTLSILPDPAVMPGDCEVEWADGGIGRNMRAAIRQVEQLVEDHFAHVPPSEDEGADEDDSEPEDENGETTKDNTEADNDSQGEDDATQKEAEATQPEGGDQYEANLEDPLNDEVPESPLASKQDDGTPTTERADPSGLPNEMSDAEEARADFSHDFSPEVALETDESPLSDPTPETEEDMK